MSDAVDIERVLAQITEPFKPRDLARANDAVLRVARLRGEFPWHTHDEDELFLCIEGEFRVELEGRDAVTLSDGQIFVVPRGLRHRPVADRDAVTLLFERPETKQYGNR
jgi:quercetin dioxygenase-like cupin family protein